MSVLDLVTEVLHVGGRELVARRRSARTFEQKRSPSDLVTDADRASEEVILHRLSELAPDDAVLSEECGFVAGRSGVTWVVDPLDGTSNYGTGLDDFGVIVGVCEGDRPVAGGMYLPACDLLYLAADGRGATRNGEPVRASATAQLEDAFVDHSLANLAPVVADQERTLAALIRSVRGVRCNHSLRYLGYVAEGTYDAFIYHSLGLWDLLGPSVILAEAGVVLTGLDGTPLALAPEEASCRTIFQAVGANPELHARLVALLATA